MSAATALEQLVPPSDPRAEWDVPPFGTMSTEADLDDLVTRVIAPNPGPMSLDGTNTYVIGVPGSGAAVVLDPGPDDEGHRRRVEDVLRRRDAQAAAVLVTHHHYDHAEAAQPWGKVFGCTVAAPTGDVAGPGGRVLQEGDTVSAAGLQVQVVATPGHSLDHMAFRLPNGVLLTGDHILGRGTSVVAFPEGDLVAYLESLRTVLRLGPDALYPGHGPDMSRDAEAVARYYLDHREFRERQILAVLGEGPCDPPAMVRRIYADVGEHLWPAAERSTRAALDKLTAEGRIREVGQDRWELTQQRYSDRQRGPHA